MCGIAGIISEAIGAEDRAGMVQKMNACMAHRGPDNDGIFSSNSVTMGHRRLSIIDLSKESDQPFFSNDRRYVIVYNGELYNYKELKLELQRSEHLTKQLPYFFSTSSDTEVVLAAFLRWGTQCLERFNGMFAFAIYDTVKQTTFIARDKMGVKPLYYHFGERGFIFASELRAILQSGLEQFRLNKLILKEYLLYQTVFAPNTIVQGVKMLQPGHFLEFENGRLTATKYYDLHKKAFSKEEQSYEAAKSRTLELLGHSVQRRMIADVPFGAFLSGGIDSSAVVALMSTVSTEKVNTFNVSFDESSFSESNFAKIIAQKYNTRHHEIKLSPDTFLKLLPEALSSMDHPGGDGPNTYVVAKATKEAGITMALSGIGGDELFAGYPVFKQIPALAKKSWINALPLFSRKIAGSLFTALKKSSESQKISDLLAEHSISFNSAFPLVRATFSKTQIKSLLTEQNGISRIAEIVNAVPQYEQKLLSAISLAEIETYMQNVLLRDTDQMSMAVALEVREPFLDHQLVEYVLSLPDEYKSGAGPKKLLVDAMGTLLPEAIVNRKKMGFTLPWEHWMRNELREFCTENINSLAAKELYNKTALQDLWNRFINKDAAVKWSKLWHLVVLNYWIDKNNIHYR